MVAAVHLCLHLNCRISNGILSRTKLAPKVCPRGTTAIQPGLQLASHHSRKPAMVATTPPYITDTRRALPVVSTVLVRRILKVGPMRGPHSIWCDRRSLVKAQARLLRCPRPPNSISGLLHPRIPSICRAAAAVAAAVLVASEGAGEVTAHYTIPMLRQEAPAQCHRHLMGKERNSQWARALQRERCWATAVRLPRPQIESFHIPHYRGGLTGPSTLDIVLSPLSLSGLISILISIVYVSDLLQSHVACALGARRIALIFQGRVPPSRTTPFEP